MASLSWFWGRPSCLGLHPQQRPKKGTATEFFFCLYLSIHSGCYNSIHSNIGTNVWGRRLGAWFIQIFSSRILRDKNSVLNCQNCKQCLNGQKYLSRIALWRSSQIIFVFLLIRCDGIWNSPKKTVSTYFLSSATTFFTMAVSQPPLLRKEQNISPFEMWP